MLSCLQRAIFHLKNNLKSDGMINIENQMFFGIYVLSLQTDSLHLKYESNRK